MSLEYTPASAYCYLNDFIAVKPVGKMTCEEIIKPVCNYSANYATPWLDVANIAITLFIVTGSLMTLFS
jgi:hypothetical protein